MSIKKTNILENISTATESVVYTDKFKAAGYHLESNGIHTAFYSFGDYAGTVKLQGTLAENPGDSDWVDIANTTIIDPPESDMVRSFTGNFIWIRAGYTLTSGSISKLAFNF
jgi:hypothetical protein